MIIFDYIAPNGCNSRCGVTIYEDQKLIMMTELADNPGMSITIAPEKVATDIYYHFIKDLLNWNMGDIIWIEHYTDGAYGSSNQPSFDRVMFLISSNFPIGIRDHYTHPTWSPSTWRPGKKSFEF